MMSNNLGLTTALQFKEYKKYGINLEGGKAIDVKNVCNASTADFKQLMKDIRLCQNIQERYIKRENFDSLIEKLGPKGNLLV